MAKAVEPKTYETLEKETGGLDETSLVGEEKESTVQENKLSYTGASPKTQKEELGKSTATNVMDTIQEVPPAPPDALLTKPETFTVRPKKRISVFRIFMTLAVIAIIVIYSFVLYLYLQNKRISEKSQMLQKTQTPTPIPTPSFSPDWIKIQNGNVVRQEPGKEPILLVKKEDFPSTGITGFARVVVSPNNKLICFESWSPALKPAIYLANLDGSDVREISPKKQNCVFREDSKAIFYVDSTPKSTPANIFVYDLESETPQEENLTKSSIPEGVVRRFSIVGFSSDSSKLICKYEDIVGGKEEKSGECEIDLQGKEVRLL